MNSKANIMRRSAFFIAFFTTIVRYYDYALFGLSASILAKEFMPAESHEEQLLKFFIVFSIAVIFRPLGSIIFGTIGDKYGRGNCVKISSFIGTISTGAFCFLPSYNSIGIIASISLLLCRILFVMSLSGEADAIKIYVREKSAKTNRNFLNGIVSSCSQIGALLAAFSFYYANKYQNMAGEQAIALWRLNFLLGSFCGWIIIYFRHLLRESEEFLTSQNNNPHKNSQGKLLDLIKSNKVPFIFAIIINGICGGIYHLLIIFWSSFNFKVLKVINQQQLSVVNMYLIATYGLCSVISGYFADKINPERQITNSLFFSFLIIAVMILSYANYNPVLTFPLLLTGLMPFYVVPLQIIVQSMFRTENRMRLYSLSHSLGAMIFSSTTPLICSLLWKFTNKIQILFGFLELLIIILTISFFYLNKMDLIVNKY